MGYNTRFSGHFRLSRQLTLAEAYEMLLMRKDPELTLNRLEAGAYHLHWVVSTDLQHIIYDGGETFYDYPGQLRALCKWLEDAGVKANGAVYWSGEYATDTGILRVTDNTVTVHEAKHMPTLGLTPLTMDELVQMALGRAAR